MNVNNPNTFITNLRFKLSLKLSPYLRLSLIIIFTLFIILPARANENTNLNESTSIDDKITRAEKIRSSQPKQFLVLINELNQQSNKLTSAQQYTLDYLNLYLLMYQGNLTEATTSARTLINSNADALHKFRAKRGLITIFASNQNWSEGLATVSSLLAELPLIQDKDAYLQTLLVIGIFYNQLGQYDLSLYYTKQVELASTQGRDQCFAKSEIIKSSFKLNRLTPTSPMIRQAISLCRINNEHVIISRINFFVAEFLLDNQQQDKALHLLNTSLQDALNTKFPRLIAGYYSLLAQGHWLNKNANLTKQFALKALENEKKEGTTVAKVLSYKLLFEVFQAQENYELALFYHQKYAIADKLYYDETQAKHLAFQLAEHKNIEQKNKINLLHEKNALLTSDKALLTAEQALNKANAENTRFIMLILLISLSVLLFWGLRLLRAHKRIKQLAEYDALTGILNRGHFTQMASNALRYCESAEQELSIIMFDLDNFKNINDSFGHACGDWALKKTVEACKSIGRQNDIFARLGGEEFCLLLTSCDKQAAFQRAEACRKAIAAINTGESTFDFTITASFGITDAKTSSYALEKLLADADSAAYASKDAGRNLVTIFEPDTAEKKVVYLDNSRDAF